MLQPLTEPQILGRLSRAIAIDEVCVCYLSPGIAKAALAEGTKKLDQRYSIESDRIPEGCDMSLYLWHPPLDPDSPSGSLHIHGL